MLPLQLTYTECLYYECKRTEIKFLMTILYFCIHKSKFYLLKVPGENIIRK